MPVTTPSPARLTTADRVFPAPVNITPAWSPCVHRSGNSDTTPSRRAPPRIVRSAHRQQLGGVETSCRGHGNVSIGRDESVLRDKSEG
jgi:hypothetical protein